MKYIKRFIYALISIIMFPITGWSFLILWVLLCLFWVIGYTLLGEKYQIDDIICYVMNKIKELNEKIKIKLNIV